MTREHFSPDTVDLLSLLQKHSVEYLIVGGEAVIYYGHARLTGDVDIFYGDSPDNIEKLYQALFEFWDGDIPGIDESAELGHPGVIVQFGVPPNRIDLINRIDGVNFHEAWMNKVSVTLPDRQCPVHYIGLNDLIRNKDSAGRSRDMADLEFLQRISRDEG